MFFDRPDSGELAVLIHIDFRREGEREDPREFEELVLSAGGDPTCFITGQRDIPDPKFFIGTGKLDEISAAIAANDAELVIFNHSLSPSQERNLEQALQCRVLDRTGLILDIFAQRARTHEGKLQVELAQLRHMSTRLVRGWTHLERQKGGIGLRGPGETQLETDRRLLRGRIQALEKRLEKVRRQREQGRRARRRAEVPTISLVGYTNAGKSTLFNALCDSKVYAADQLFATLDPTMRRLQLDGFGPIVLADTVGFIRHLPHRLVEAFRATLEEAASADLLIHVIDCAAEERQENIEQVNEVLKEIGANEIPHLDVYNKIDLLDDTKVRIDRDEQGKPRRVWLSARDQVGLEELAYALAEHLGQNTVEHVVRLPPNLARLRAKLYELGYIQKEQFADSGASELWIRCPQSELNRLLATEQTNLDDLLVSDNDEMFSKNFNC